MKDFWHKRKYLFRLFTTAFLCIWTVVLSFAWFVYKQEIDQRERTVIARIDLANSNLAETHATGGDMQAALRFIKNYLDETYLRDISLQIYDTRTRQMVYSAGEIYDGIPPEAATTERIERPDHTQVMRIVEPSALKNKRRLYFYGSRITADGQLDIRTYVPFTPAIDEAVSINPTFWIFLLGVGALGTTLAYIATRHQAKNVDLLQEFASRAADDKDFIPMGDFPSDEIGEISRLIVSIYNSRTQANLRREHEHEIALQAIEEKNRMKRVLTNNISHELKTPIGIIRAYVDMMLNQPDMSEEDRKRFLEKTQVNIERLVAMLNDLSTMTRLEESGGKIPMKEVNFHQIVANIAEDNLVSGFLGDMNFRYNIPEDCYVIGNEGLLNSVIQNLIKNSVAYSQGTEIGVDMLGKTENYYTFAIYDNGVGVGKEHLPHLFDRFYRVDTGRSRKAGGTGLGLPIVKSSINNMGGSISVRNRRTGGLEFIFTLPRSKPHES